MQPHNNIVMLRGNLGADPIVRVTSSKVSVCNFKVATNERYLGSDGTTKQRTQWHRITVWGKMAELCGKYLTKGHEVSIIGKLQTNHWVDKEGYEYDDVEIHTMSVEFLRKPRREEPDQEVVSEGEDAT